MKNDSKIINLKSKKGFSLLELLCAVLIIAIVVGATATGLAISYKSVTLGGIKDKANAKAQEYCDILMTYVENVSSIPSSASGYYSLVDADENNLENDIPAIKCYTNKNNLDAKIKKTDDVYYTITSSGDINKADGTKLTSYEITVYVDYTSENTTYCKGTVTRA